MSERIAAALHSSDLEHHERPCDADTVRALGLTAIRRPLGVLILEAKEACAGDSPGDAARLRDLIVAVADEVRKQADRDRLTVNHHAVAIHMVKEVVLDRCPRCSGRGFLPLAYGPDSPVDERGVDCPVCLGTGRARRDFDRRAEVAGQSVYTMRLRTFYGALEDRLTEAEIHAGYHYGRRFSRD